MRMPKKKTTYLEEGKCHIGNKQAISNPGIKKLLFRMIVSVI
jgi:hypothetical protein